MPPATAPTVAPATAPAGPPTIAPPTAPVAAPVAAPCAKAAVEPMSVTSTVPKITFFICSSPVLIDAGKQTALPNVPGHRRSDVTTVPALWMSLAKKNPVAWGARQGYAERSTDHKRRANGGPSRICGRQLVQTFMDFMPVSASVRVLKVPSSTMVVVVVVGFLSTMVHFFVVVSLTT